MGVLKNVKPGKYNCELRISDEGSWGDRVASLSIQHVEERSIGYAEDSGIDVGVDSGQAGIFDDSLYPKNVESNGEYGELDTFYGKACALTYDENDREVKGGILDGKGVVSSSGYGDGSYTCLIAKNKKGQIVAIEIVFIGDEDDNIDDDEVEDF
jgi:hypothetical protein